MTHNSWNGKTVANIIIVIYVVSGVMEYNDLYCIFGCVIVHDIVVICIIYRIELDCLFCLFVLFDFCFDIIVTLIDYRQVCIYIYTVRFIII